MIASALPSSTMATARAAAAWGSEMATSAKRDMSALERLRRRLDAAGVADQDRLDEAVLAERSAPPSEL